MLSISMTLGRKSVMKTIGENTDWKGFCTPLETEEHYNSFAISWLCEWLDQHLNKTSEHYQRCLDFMAWAKKQSSLIEVCNTAILSAYYFHNSMDAHSYSDFFTWINTYNK